MASRQDIEAFLPAACRTSRVLPTLARRDLFARALSSKSYARAVKFLLSELRHSPVHLAGCLSGRI